MYADALTTDKYDVEEITRMDEVKHNLFYRICFSNKINSCICVPFKGVWDKCYPLGRYQFKNNEKYAVIFLNGSIRHFFSLSFFRKFKKRHPNVKLILTLYDSLHNVYSKQTLKMLKYFDTVFSYDEEDCGKRGFERIYHTLSKPNFVFDEAEKHTSVFFIGEANSRERILKSAAKKNI